MPSVVANNGEGKLTEFAFRRYVDFRLLRVGPGQNGQILFISVEQLPRNVADDSAKTL